jgi:protein involved in polysaccharide export with SLBB domain
MTSHIRSLPRAATALTALLLVAGAAGAQGYTVVSGDVLEISSLVAPETVTTVDLDGQIRLAGAGTVVVEGLTLDEIEAEIEAAMTAVGEILDPDVVVSIADHAPVLVGGDVEQPGRYDYVPRMDAATALALAGGISAFEIDGFDVDRALVAADARVIQSNREIAVAVAQAARFDAIADGDDAISQPLARLDRIPSPARVDLDALMDAEVAIFENAQARARELRASWATEIAAQEAQRALVDDRIAVQDRVVAQAAQELADARQLQERGLQTTARLSNVERREADATTRALELEAIGIGLDQAIADTRRRLIQFDRDRRDDALLGLREALLDLEAAILRHDQALADKLLLTGGGATALVDAGAVRVDYDIRRARADGIEVADATTPLLPGDVLTVEVIPVAAADGG